MARMGQLRWAHATSMWDVRMGNRRNGRPKFRWPDTFKRLARGQWSRRARKLVKMEYNQTPVQAASLVTVHLAIKHSHCPWFHQEAVALMELIGLIIYLFTCLFIYVYHE